MLTIHETMGMGIIGPAAVCDLKLNQMQLASLTAAAFVGIICSSYFWGYITDKKGRRWTLQRTLVASCICSIVSMFMVNFPGFFIMKFFNGVFVAGPSFVSATYLAEFCHKRLLSRVVTHMYMFTGFAMMFCPAMATGFISPDTMQFEVHLVGSLYLRNWRLLGCSFVLPGVLAFVLLLIMPESPKFLFMIGETDKGMAVMDWISRKNTGKSLNEEQINELLRFQEFAQVKRRKSDKTILRTMANDAMPLFRTPYVGTYLGACIIMFVLGLLAHGVGIWFTAIRNRVNMQLGSKEGRTMCEILFVPQPGAMLEPEEDFIAICDDDFKGFNDSFILGCTYVVLYMICWALLFRVPRKVIFVTAMVVSATSGFILVRATDPWLQLFSLIFLLGLPGAIVGLLGGALLENVPTYIRAKAMCICLMWCRCGAVVGTVLFGLFIHRNCELFLLLVSTLCL
ncbi:hypothetical protein KR009_008053, partial [Drosophila setifemur]